MANRKFRRGQYTYLIRSFLLLGYTEDSSTNNFTASDKENGKSFLAFID